MKRDNTMTKRYFADAGMAEGMRVIELGCGGGEVTQLLAELVGPSGRVVAIDRDPKAVAATRERMNEHAIEHVRVVSADLSDDLSGFDDLRSDPFDALAGRRVLMYLPDPVEVLRRCSRSLRGGALVVFEETDTVMVPARVSPMAAHDRAAEWLQKMLVAEGANTAMGFGLPSTFVQAGLQFERIRAEAVIQGQGTQYPLPELLKLVQARVISAGIATQDEVDALAARLVVESADPTAVYVSEMSFCAWAYKPKVR
ncbi:MAG: methyltransferase domain-containing protein [Acidobacteriota bacterium]